jgi:predicted transcriptional regulator
VARLSELFAVLSTGSRIRILHVLSREGEMHVQSIAARIGMAPAAVSSQLRLMALLGILSWRSEGRRVLYVIVDPCVPQLLETGACLILDAKAGAR